MCARAEEIRLIEESINKNRKKNLLFQRLPFYKRRRTRSFARKNIKKRGRGIQAWYSRRFEMMKIEGVKMPIKRRLKSDSYIYKSFSRGFLVYESYKEVYVFEKDSGAIKGECFETENYVFSLISLGETVDKDCCIKQIDTAISVIGDTFKESGVYETSLNADSEYKFYCKIDEYIENWIIRDFKLIDEMPQNKIIFLFLKSEGSLESGKVFIKNCFLLKFFQKMTSRGSIPISIEELFRIGIEKKRLIFPFDCVETKFSREYERIMLEKNIKEYERKPKSKRAKNTFENVDFDKIENRTPIFFDVPKGCVDKSAVVLCGSKIVGIVLRSMYCYSIGQCRGLCFINKEYQSSALCVRNLNSDKLIPIKITRDN